jgi:hypothetical protein
MQVVNSSNAVVTPRPNAVDCAPSASSTTWGMEAEDAAAEEVDIGVIVIFY